LLAVQELARLNSLQAVYQPLADGGDVAAAKLLLEISDRRCRLCGLYPQDGQPVLNLNVNGNSAQQQGIQVSFIPSRFRNEEIPSGPDDYGKDLDITRLRLVGPGGGVSAASTGMDYDTGPEPSAPQPVHAEVIRDRSRVPPDPVGARTELWQNTSAGKAGMRTGALRSRSTGCADRRSSVAR
jgi:hypothetical protein